MVSRHLIVKFYLWFLLALTLTVIAVAGTFALLSDDEFRHHTDAGAISRAKPVRDLVQGMLDAGLSPRAITRLLAPLLEELSASMTLLSEKGEPLEISRPEGLPPERFFLPTTAEVEGVLRDGPRVWKDWRHRVGVALPLRLPRGERGVFLGTMHIGFRRHGGPPYRILGGLGAVLALGWLLCWPLAAYLARPLKRLAAAADSLGEGRLDTRINLKRKDEIGRLADRFNAMAGNLQKLMAGHKQLLADVSHELRSPLARLRVALELARREGGSGAAPYLDQMENQTEALDGLIGELLAHSRLEVMPYDLRLEPLLPGALAGEALAALEPEARNRRISFSLEDRAGVEEFLGDRQLLRRALTNGLSNALAYAPEGSTVQLELARETGNLAFRIADEGPGVPPEMLEKIFQPFFRADSARSRATGGVGLGLAIVRRSMEAHGGGAQAEAGAGGRGFVLTLWLPGRAPEGEEPARG